jgi:energy-coupling factor transport system permease protein
MLRDLTLGSYFPGDSILHRLQARTKLLALFWIFGVLVVANHRQGVIAPQLAVTVVVLLAAGLSGVSFKQLWRRTRILAVALIGAAIFMLLDRDGTPIVNHDPVVITDDGVWIFVSAGVMLVILYLAALLLTLTTSPVALGEGLSLLLAPLRRFHLPVDDFALMSLIALRFIPTLIGNAEMLIEAQVSRGADLRHGSIRERIGRLAALFIPLVHGVLRRAEDLALALDARGYAEDSGTTIRYETRLGLIDGAALGVTAAVTLLAFAI